MKGCGGVPGQDVQNLPVELGECRGPAGVQVQDAKRFPTLDVDHGFLGVGARHGPQRKDHDGAQPLRHNALRRLQIHLRLRQILGDDGSLLPERQLDGGLAWCDALWRKPKAAAAARQFHFEHARGVRFE